MTTTPTGERRAQERAAVRQRIVETALRLLEEEGAASLTMRRVATEMGYTAPIVYQHFDNKDALVLELVAHGYDMLTQELRRLPAELAPEPRLVEAASAYVRFAGEHPHLHEAMNSANVDAAQRLAAAEPVIVVLDELLTAWADAHRVHLGDRSDACDVVWGTLYGLAALGRLDTMGNERAQRLAGRALSAMLLGWRAGGIDPGTP